MRALAADARADVVHGVAGVRALDLVELLVHALMVVGVHVAQPDRCLVGFLADLGPAQHAAPQRLHAVIRCVLDVMRELTAAGSVTRFEHDLFELGHAVFKQFDGGRRRDTGRPLPGQGKR